MKMRFFIVLAVLFFLTENVQSQYGNPFGAPRKDDDSGSNQYRPPPLPAPLPLATGTVDENRLQYPPHDHKVKIPAKSSNQTSVSEKDAVDLISSSLGDYDLGAIFGIDVKEQSSPSVNKSPATKLFNISVNREVSKTNITLVGYSENRNQYSVINSEDFHTPPPLAQSEPLDYEEPEPVQNSSRLTVAKQFVINTNTTLNESITGRKSSLNDNPSRVLNLEQLTVLPLASEPVQSISYYASKQLLGSNVPPVSDSNYKAVELGVVPNLVVPTLVVPPTPLVAILPATPVVVKSEDQNKGFFNSLWDSGSIFKSAGSLFTNKLKKFSKHKKFEEFKNVADLFGYGQAPEESKAGLVLPISVLQNAPDVAVVPNTFNPPNIPELIDYQNAQKQINVAAGFESAGQEAYENNFVPPVVPSNEPEVIDYQNAQKEINVAAGFEPASKEAYINSFVAPVASGGLQQSYVQETSGDYLRYEYTYPSAPKPTFDPNLNYRPIPARDTIRQSFTTATVGKVDSYSQPYYTPSPQQNNTNGMFGNAFNDWYQRGQLYINTASRLLRAFWPPSWFSETVDYQQQVHAAPPNYRYSPQDLNVLSDDRHSQQYPLPEVTSKLNDVGASLNKQRVGYRIQTPSAVENSAQTKGTISVGYRYDPPSQTERDSVPKQIINGNVGQTFAYPYPLDTNFQTVSGREHSASQGGYDSRFISPEADNRNPKDSAQNNFFRWQIG